MSPKLAFSGLEKLRGFFSSRLLANMCPNNKIYWDLTLCLKAKLVLCCNGVLQKLIPSCFVGVELSNIAHIKWGDIIIITCQGKAGKIHIKILHNNNLLLTHLKVLGNILLIFMRNFCFALVSNTPGISKCR